MKYRALSNIPYNCRSVVRGDIVDLMEAEAAPLVAGGLLEKVDTKQPGAALPKEEPIQ